jgi:hypothetical protein
MKRPRSTSGVSGITAALAAVASLAVACGDQGAHDLPQAASNPCRARTAQILVGDGFQKLICGCQESSERVIASSSGPATCTVSTGTVIFFHYLGTQLSHQIVPRDGANFPASPVSDPSAEKTLPVHGFRIDAVGTYSYADAYDSGINGRILVQ